jgi:hypothetical protein
VIRIGTHGLDAVVREFRAMHRRSQDLSPAWQEFLDWWSVSNREQFASRGRRWRTPWKPLAPSTVAEKRRKGFISDPLVRDAKLRGELVGRPLGVEHISASAVDAGTDISYAKFHQGGTRKMPARRLVNLEQVGLEGAAGAVVLTWIVSGEPNTGGVSRLER